MRETAEPLERIVWETLDLLPADSRQRAMRSVTGFRGIFPRRPVADTKGGTGYNGCLWLFAVARGLAPRLIVESGVFRGNTSWLLRHACPEAAILSFDPDLSNLVYRDPEAQLHDRDWMEVVPPRIDPDTSLAFFDDHVNQAQRVIEAHDRGFRWLLFDDNHPADSLAATGTPPVPTISMVFDDGLLPGAEIRWVRHGRPRIYRHDAATAELARRRIAAWTVLPDLSAVTGMTRYSRPTLVRLVG